MTLPFFPTALRIAAGAIVWALHFAATYGFTALACARGLGGVVPWVVGSATLAGVVALAWLLFLERGRDGFEPWLARAIAALALVAVVFETVPLFIVRPCA